MKEQENNFIRMLQLRLPQLEYIDGYNGSESKVRLKCKICNTETIRCASLIREKHYNHFKCLGCSKIESNKRKETKKQINKIVSKYDKEHSKFIKDFYNYIEKNTIHIIHCKFCNDEIYSFNNRRMICDKCRNTKHKHSYKSLSKLYKRDNGVCHICNKQCDYNDYVYKGNTFIAGNNYPSIDHIIPLNKGGSDDWNNIKLAHRICNTMKRDY